MRGERRRRGRGASAVEYMLVLLFVGAASVFGYRSFSIAFKCRILVAVGVFSSGNKPAACQDAESGGGTLVASNDPPSGGGGLGPSPGGVCVGGVCTRPGQCFAAGTLVTTPSGPRPIEQLEAGDEVLSRDERTGEVLPARVLQTFVTPDRPLVAVTLAGEDGAEETLEATPGHLFYTEARGWQRADALRGDDRLLDPVGRTLLVRGLASLDRRATVYNFEVEGTHTYFVGALATWVHNPPDPSDPSSSQDPNQVPPMIHAIWPDEAIPPAQLHHLLNWADKADGTRYTVHFWTTQHGIEELQHTIGPDGKSQYQTLQEHGVQVHDVLPVIPDRMKPYFTESLRTHSWAMASDIARYSYLREHGGIHIDVDIDPRNVDLHQPPPRVENKDVPIIAPEVRLEEDWKKAAEAVGKPNSPTDTSHNPAIIEYLYGVRDGEPPGVKDPHLNTIFIMAAPHAKFFDKVDDRIIQNLGLSSDVTKDSNGVPTFRDKQKWVDTITYKKPDKTVIKYGETTPHRQDYEKPPGTVVGYTITEVPVTEPVKTKRAWYGKKKPAPFGSGEGKPQQLKGQLFDLQGQPVRAPTFNTSEAGSRTGPGPFKDVLRDDNTPLSQYELKDPNFLNMQLVTPASNDTQMNASDQHGRAPGPAPVVGEPSASSASGGGC